MGMATATATATDIAERATNRNRQPVVREAEIQGEICGA